MKQKKQKISNVKHISRQLFVALVCTILSGSAFAQSAAQTSTTSNPYVRLGNKAIMDGDYKAAVNALQKVKNPDTLVTYMLGYSQIRCAEYKNAIGSFTKLLAESPNNFSAYYWRGKARNTLATQNEGKLKEDERERMLQASIDDFSNAIRLNPGDLSYYQSRGIAYRDLGILFGTEATDKYNKTEATSAYEKSIEDLEHVLASNAKREDLAKEIKKVKVYRDNLN